MAEALPPPPDDADLPPLQTPVVVEDANGQQFDADATELDALIRSGQYKLAPDQYQQGGAGGVPVTVGGETRFLPADQADAAIRSFEGDATSGEAARQADLARSYDNPLDKARAFSAGALRTGSFGASDHVLTAIRPELADEMAAYKTYLPGATTAGEVGGAVLPFLAGGAGLVGGGLRAAGAGVRGVAAGAEMAGAGVTRALGGGALARGAGAAVRGGLEVGAFEAGQEVSAAALQKRELDAAKVASAFGHGALLGAATMGAGSLAWSGAKGGAGMVYDAAGNAIRSRVTAATDALQGGLASAREAGASGLEKLAQTGSEIRDAAQGAIDGKLLPYLKNDLKEPAIAFAKDKALSATGGTQKQLAKILEGSPEVREAADRLLAKEIPEVLKKKAGAILTRSEMSEGLALAKRNIGSEMGQTLKAVDANARGIGPDVAKVVREAEEKILSRLESNAFAEAETTAIRKQIAALSEYSGQRVGFEGMHELSSRLGETIRRRATSAELPELKQLKGLIDDEIMAGATRVSEEIGGDLAATFRATKQRYAAASMLEKAIDTGIAAEKKNATIGLREMLGGGTGAQMGGMVGGLVGGAPGAMLGGLVGGAAGSAVARISKTYGDQIASTAIRRFYEGASPSAIAAEIDAAIGTSVARYLDPAKALGKKAIGAAKTALPMVREAVEGAAEQATSSARRAADRAVGKVAEVGAAVGRVADTTGKTARAGIVQAEAEIGRRLFGDAPQTATREAPKPVRLAARTDPRKAVPAPTVRDVRARLEESRDSTRARYEAMAAQYPALAPEIAGSLKASERTHAYLLSTLPQSANQKHSLTPQAESPRLTPQQKADMATRVRVAESPLSVLASLEAGTLSRVEVEALQATAPEVYEQIRGDVQRQLDARSEPLPYKKALEVSLLLGVVGHPSLDPRAVQALQAAYAPPPPQAQPGPPAGAPKREIRRSQDWSLKGEVA